MMNRLLFLCLLLLLAGCARQPRTIVAEPLKEHDREQDHAYCQEHAQKYGVINMEPLMSGSGMETFPDRKRQVQLYEACMLKQGYRFQ